MTAVIAIDDTAVRQDDLSSEQLVARQSIPAAQDADAAAEGEAGNAHGVATAGRQGAIGDVPGPGAHVPG